MVPNVVLGNNWPTLGLKSTASANSNWPSGSKPPISTLFGEKFGISLYAIPALVYEFTS